MRNVNVRLEALGLYNFVKGFKRASNINSGGGGSGGF